MNVLIKILLLAGSGSLLSLVIGALVTKIIAVNMGPEGLVMYSQIRQIGQWFILFGTINGASSIIRLIARDNGIPIVSKIFTFLILLGTGILLSIVLFSLSKNLINNILLGSHIEISTALMSIVIFSGSLSMFVLSVVNGLGKSKQVVKLQIISSLSSLIFVYPLIKYFQYDFIYVLLSIGFFLIIFYGVIFLKKRIIISPKDVYFNKNIAKEHLSLGTVLLVTGILGASTQIYIRTLYINFYGLVKTGLFDAAWGIGMMYIMVVLSSFSIYIIPRLSKIEDNLKLNLFINRNFLVIFGVTSLAIITMMILKEYIILVLYTDEFMEAKIILRWMLFGDFLKVSGWIFGAVLLARGDKKLFFLTELIFNLLLIFVTTMFVDKSFEAIGFSFVIANIVYLLIVYILVSKKYEIYLEEKNKILWIFGLCLVLFAGVGTYGS